MANFVRPLPSRLIGSRANGSFPNPASTVHKRRTAISQKLNRRFFCLSSFFFRARNAHEVTIPRAFPIFPNLDFLA